MSQFDLVYNDMGSPEGSISLVANDGRSWEIPENTACICFDSDGEIYAFESGDVATNEHGAWIDKSVDGFCVKVGKVHHAEVSDSWQQPIWLKSEPKKKSSAQVAADNAEKAMQALMTAESKPAKPILDGGKLRARVTEILDKRIKDGKPGARRARTGLKDLGSAGFDFTNYSTMALFTFLLDIGYDFRLHRDYTVIEAIDSAVVEARAE
ncbi:hypothetical protein HAZELMIKA_65 [Klebsiella phage vB_KaeD_HazelMika]|nr:hypothetical protein HAZELMIKA_65 [Klebsiella phage vB_KaeD_HazelMika]